MESQTEQNAASLQILLPEKPLELQLWLVDELTILAEAIGEVVTTGKGCASTPKTSRLICHETNCK